ncbi:MAG: hypothetical protein EP343_05510 [Deltaproteobacteria bacterium]|nr:MAG: hypothetical protein EP343_05510 [Deltaproteobacteria bacterium]
MRDFWNNLKFILFALALSWAILQQPWKKPSPTMAKVTTPPVVRSVPSKTLSPQRWARPLPTSTKAPKSDKPHLPSHPKGCEPQLQSADVLPPTSSSIAPLSI